LDAERSKQREEIKKPSGRVLAWRKEHQQADDEQRTMSRVGEGKGWEKRERQAASYERKLGDRGTRGKKDWGEKGLRGSSNLCNA
jgi:hypothetical protein